MSLFHNHLQVCRSTCSPCLYLSRMISCCTLASTKSSVSGSFSLLASPICSYYNALSVDKTRVNICMHHLRQYLAFQLDIQRHDGRNVLAYVCAVRYNDYNLLSSIAHSDIESVISPLTNFSSLGW